jgi:hypothetical protein
MKRPSVYTGEVKDNALELTRFGAVVEWLGQYLHHFMWWRWLEVKLQYDLYCARCGGCGYVDCCGIKCDRGLFCCNFYEEKECIKSNGLIHCIPWEPLDLAEEER